MPTSVPDPEAPPFRWWRTAWRLALRPVGWVARLGWRVRIRRDVNPPAGPAVFAANHVSHLDIPMVGVAVARPLRFLAVDGLWREHWWLTIVLRVFAAIPLSRSRAPLGALRVALTHLAAGDSIGVFPEGGIQEHWGAVRPHPAAAWLCVHGEVPLVPVAVSGTEHAYGLGATRVRRSKVTVRLGVPLRPDDFRTAEDPVAAMMDAWSEAVASMLQP